MTRTITFYTLEKKRVQVEMPHDFFEFYEKRNNFLRNTSLHPYGEPMKAIDALDIERHVVPVHHYGRILPNGKDEEEHYALHPQIQEFIERELRRKKYLSDETVNNIRTEDSRVIQALSEEVRDLKKEVLSLKDGNLKLRGLLDRETSIVRTFQRSGLRYRLYVALFPHKL